MTCREVVELQEEYKLQHPAKSGARPVPGALAGKFRPKGSRVPKDPRTTE